MGNEQQTVTKLNRRSASLRIIGLILILTSFLTFIFYTRHQRKELENQTTLIEKKDSVLTVLKDSTNHLRSKEDSVVALVTAFLKAKKDSINCRKYFSDPVANYYGYRNLKVKDIIATKTNFLQKYPRVKAEFSKDDISVHMENDTTLVYASLKDYLDSLLPNSYYQRTFKIKLNPTGKVFYITAYREEDEKIKN